MTDTERLDALEACCLSLNRVVCRESSTGRGWRLHEIDEYVAKQRGVKTFGTVREAIDAFVSTTELLDIKPLVWNERGEP